MSRLFYHTCQDNAGNLLFDVSGTMRLAGSGTLATIYGDEALTVILPNPMTNHPSFGSFKCFLDVGDYDFYLAKSGYTFETLTGVQGWGTMALQNASAVAITGGDIQATRIAVGMPVSTTVAARITYPSASNQYGITLTPSLGGAATPVVFTRWDQAVLTGTITTTDTSTSYNTSSDVRLKRAITPLAGALEVVRALRPISHRWIADDSPGVGFLAHEVAEIVDGVITGTRDAVEEDGSIRPQMIDHSKLVVYLVGACKELAAQVEALTARLEAAGA